MGNGIWAAMKTPKQQKIYKRAKALFNSVHTLLDYMYHHCLHTIWSGGLLAYYLWLPYLIQSWVETSAMAPASLRRGTSLPSWCFSITAANDPERKKTQKIIKRFVNGGVLLYLNWMQKGDLQSHPPMCFPPINTLGTVLWPVHSLRADWISAPSPSKHKISRFKR